MHEFDRLVSIMARLRAPDGCPWDREQDHHSIRKYVIEEAYEVAEAIDREDPGELCSELGDLLLQVVFHAQMAREAGRFDVTDVCRAIAAKLERRHPHVFGDVEVSGASDVAHNWERIKAAERGAASSAIDGVPRSLPALQRAERVGEKASRVGFDWPEPAAVLDKIDEERREVEAALAGRDGAAIEHEIGDLLLAVANLARKAAVEPERALAGAVDRFAARFRHAEETARAAGHELRELDAAALEGLWQQAKSALGGPGVPPSRARREPGRGGGGHLPR